MYSIVVLGGGTGTHTVLSGLKAYVPDVSLSVIVTMADSGGSTGRLRDEFGYLPVGDVRMALAALADDGKTQERLMRELFLYRFDKGKGIAGHNFGNLFLVALTDILGSEEEAIRVAADVLRVKGKVLPVTTAHVDLVATYEDGVEVTGETHIDEPAKDRDQHRITDLTTTPACRITDAARAAIENADLIILGPGDLYTSVLATCVVEGASEAIQKSDARIAYVANLMTKFGQTTNMGITEHVAEIERYLHRVPDYVFINTEPLPEELVAKYAETGEYPLEDNYAHAKRAIRTDLLMREEVETQSGDVLKRSLIRHDPQKLATALTNTFVGRATSDNPKASYSV